MPANHRFPILGRIFAALDHTDQALAADPQRRERLRLLLRGLIQILIEAMIQQFLPAILAAIPPDEDPQTHHGTPRT